VTELQWSSFIVLLVSWAWSDLQWSNHGALWLESEWSSSDAVWEIHWSGADHGQGIGLILSQFFDV